MRTSIELVVRDETIGLDGLQFHYRDWGDPAAPPLVLLHGYTSHARSWDTVARALAGRYRVLALDQRGHGESEWAHDYHELRLVSDLASFVDTLELDSFSMVGFSIGAYAACAFALLHPGRVRYLALAECFVEDPSEARVPTEGSRHIDALRSLPAAFAGDGEIVAAQAAAAYRPLAPFASEEELRRWMFTGLKQGPGDRWTWRYDPVLRVPGAPGRLNPIVDVFDARLAAVTDSTLMVVGAESFQAEPAEQMARRNPGKHLVKIPQAGHWVPMDNPDGFLGAVSRFLAS